VAFAGEMMYSKRMTAWSYRVGAALALFAPLALPRAAEAAPTVWAIDDGEKIKQDAPPPPLATGEGNPIWSPGQPIRLFAMKNETVAFQVVVHASEPLSSVTVDLASLAAESAKIENAPDAKDPTRYVGRPIERFVEHFFDIRRASAGRRANESLGWAAGSGPAPGKWTGKMPDALIPVEAAPPWSPYPMNIAAGANGVVWIDVTVGKTQPPGVYKGTVVVKASGADVTSLPVELEVVNVTLADRPVRTMLFYDRTEIDRRFGGGAAADAAEKHLFRLYHRHRVSPMHNALGADEIVRRLEALDGSLYTAKNGYEGPGEGMGDGVLSLGAYGGLGEPNEAALRTVESIADRMAEKNVLATTDTFVYAIDETCGSPYGAAWKSLIAGSPNANVKKVRVAWTCSEDASTQPVDIPIQAAAFDPAKTAKARAAGKEVWAYNGRMPQTGAFMTDTSAISLRVDGWLSGMFDIGRWFYWETTFWYDDNRGGKGPYDPFETAETFHNADGDYCMGDGVLVYPGKQVDMFTSRSIGMDGVIASIRLKNWRRGIQDAGYYRLAHDAKPEEAEAIARSLMPKVFVEARDGKPVSWPEEGKPWFDARKALLALIPNGALGGADPGPSSGAPSGASKSDSSGCGCRAYGRAASAMGVACGVAVIGLLLYRRRSRKS
jgi:hypothetical protein